MRTSHLRFDSCRHSKTPPTRIGQGGGAGIRLRCPAKTSHDKAGSFSADRSTHCALAVSATGGARARGRNLTSGSIPAVIAKLPRPGWVRGVLVPATGIEPVRILLRGILSPLCLPIPPCRQVTKCFVGRGLAPAVTVQLMISHFGCIVKGIAKNFSPPLDKLRSLGYTSSIGKKPTNFRKF